MIIHSSGDASETFARTIPSDELEKFNNAETLQNS